MTASLVPELYVSDFGRSLAFYTTLLEFRIVYARLDEDFAFLTRDSASLMIEQPAGRAWLLAPLEQPYGRGISFQIAVDEADQLHARLGAAGVEPFVPIETHDYRRAHDIVTVRQFVIADPDGYLLRFSQTLSTRPIAPTDQSMGVSR